MKVYKRDFFGPRPQARYPGAECEAETRDMDVAICYGTNMWHLDIDNTTGDETVFPVRDRTVNMNNNLAAGQTGPGSLVVKTLNIQNQVEHVFSSHYRHEINPDYFMRWHGQKNARDLVGNVGH
jgi:hypothetical protein